MAVPPAPTWAQHLPTPFLSKLDLPHWKNIAGLCFVIKMQFDIPGIELRHYRIDASFNGRMVRAVTGDKLLEYRPGGQRPKEVCAV